MKKLLLLLVAVSILACKKDEPIDPWNVEQLVQLIANNDDWQKEYSDANIAKETKFVQEYNSDQTVYTLYPETADELIVIYSDSLPQELYWNKSGQWKTDYGTVGDPVSILEKANEAPISFYGLGYDLPGKVKIDTGKLADKNITFAVRPTSDIIPSEYYSAQSFPLADQASKELQLFITRVQIEIPAKAAAQ